MAEYTLKAEDADKTLEVNDENPNNTVKIIVPEHSNSPIPIGTEIKVYRGNEAQAEFEPQNNVEIVSARKEIYAPTFFIRKYGEAQIRKRALNQWVLKGDLLYFNIFAEGGDDVFEIEQNGQLYRVHAFTTVGSNQFDVITRNNEISEVDVLVVAGGGSGAATPGQHKGGGGGAGGLVFVPRIPTEKKVYLIQVGNGGNSVGLEETFDPIQGNPGQNSLFGDLVTALGGGRGGQFDNTSEDFNGGSGGGGHYGISGGQGLQPLQTGFSGAPYGFGNIGGVATGEFGFGGGGAGDFGRNNEQGIQNGEVRSQAFSGGEGLSQVTINGIDYNFAEMFGTEYGEVENGQAWFAGGGGGGRNAAGADSYGAGGLGGGGRGAFDGAGFTGTQWGSGSSAGEAAMPNTGGGGGSARQGISGAGGSGIVIVRYPIRRAED